MPFRWLYLIKRVAGALSRRLGLQIATLFHRATLGAVGAGTRFQLGVNFHPSAQVSFGRNCYVWRGVDASSESPTGSLRVGDRVQINRDVHLDMTGGLVIGDDVMLSESAVLYTHEHGLDPRSAPQLRPKMIGSGVWVGMRAIILAGCREIGVEAVIGAGAVVTKDVPAGAIVAGNPARIIGRNPAVKEVA